MISPSDKDYQQTKLLKRSGSELASPFKELSHWINENYEIQVLNIYFDIIYPDKTPRINIILETSRDAALFKEQPYGHYKESDQKRVQEQFESILKDQKNSKFNIDKLLVIFTAFEPVAKWDANEKVTQFAIENLKKTLEHKDLWKIRKRFEYVTFFFHTDEQLKYYENSETKELFAREYLQLVAPYDEFGYLQNHGIDIEFDSKENFDKNYSSNWFYYDR